MSAKYYIYWNLHRKCYSVKHRGKVIQHFHKAGVFRPAFKVSAKGRERVRREGVKNVHAYIVCEAISVYPYDSEVMPTAHTANYNPYKNENFVDNAGNALYNAQSAELTMIQGKPVIYIRSAT